MQYSRSILRTQTAVTKGAFPRFPTLSLEPQIIGRESVWGCDLENPLGYSVQMPTDPVRSSSVTEKVSALGEAHPIFGHNTLPAIVPRRQSPTSKKRSAKFMTRRLNMLVITFAAMMSNWNFSQYS